MRLTALFSLCVCVSAQVRITKGNDRISVEIDGQPFTALFFGPEVAKPYLYPLRAASGTIVTRRFPLEESPGDSTDHPQHRGLTFAHADLNGINYWANEPFNRGKKGRIVLEEVLSAEGGAKSGQIHALLHWLDPNGSVLMTDTRRITFHAHPTLRSIDFDIAVKAVEPVKFGDTHEGSFGVRVAAFLEEPTPAYVPLGAGEKARPTEPKRTGRITNSNGSETEAQVRGKRANWADYSGEYQGEKVGIAIFDHPGNPRHPTYWHTRGYGMFAANIFGIRTFENNKSLDGSLSLEPGKQLRFRYRVVIHPGDTVSAGIAKLYQEYAHMLR
jgi:hypothetical protein